MVILKKLFSFRPFVILAALLLVASSCSATLLLGIHSFTLYERKGVHDSFQTIAVPNCGSCDHNDAGEIESRYIKLDEAVDAASHSEFFDEKKTCTNVIGYCADVRPTVDTEMHASNISSNTTAHTVYYNGTHPCDVGLYEGFCSQNDMQIIPIKDPITGRVTLARQYEISISVKKSLYQSNLQKTSAITGEIRFLHAAVENMQFQKKKRYLIMGTFITMNYDSQSFMRFALGAHFANNRDYPDYPDYPVCVELPDGLTAEEYLATEEGKKKFGDVIEMFEKNIHSVPVVLTDSLMSMYNFSAGITPIKEGRAFTDEEYASGAQVCVISTALAKANDLKVGDRLEFQFYNRGKLYAEDTRLATDTEFYAPYFNGITPITDTMEYEIVGICKNDKFLFGEHDFTPNTVFIPSASMTDEAVRENLNADWEPMSTKLTSVIIENGKLYEFREEMESLGYGDCFLYSDENGMTDVFLAAVERENHIKPIFCASAIVFAAVALICTILAGFMIKRTDEYKEILAQSRAKAYFAAVLSTFTFSACALLLGVIASYFLFDTVAALLIGANTGVDFSLISALKALGLEAAVTAVGSAIGGIGGKGRRKVTGEAPAKSIK